MSETWTIDAEGLRARTRPSSSLALTFGPEVARARNGAAVTLSRTLRVKQRIRAKRVGVCMVPLLRVGGVVQKCIRGRFVLTGEDVWDLRFRQQIRRRYCESYVYEKSEKKGIKNPSTSITTCLHLDPTKGTVAE